MVSLASDSFSGPSGSRGAFFFDDSALGVENDESPAASDDKRFHGMGQPSSRGSINDEDAGDDVDLLVPDPVFRAGSRNSDDPDEQFRPSPIPWLVAVEILCFLALEVVVFLVPRLLPTTPPKMVLRDDEAGGLLPYYILLYTHGGFWFLVFLFDRLHWCQCKKLQSLGYLDFYRSTRSWRQAPLLVTSFSNSVILIMSTVLQQFPRSHFSASPTSAVTTTSPGGKTTSLDENNVLQILVSFEVVVVLPCLLFLLITSARFNSARHPPDVRRDEALMQSTVPGLRGHSARDVGFRDLSVLQDGVLGSDVFRGQNVLSVDELLEKQADMIRYLKYHNSNLSRKILKLTAELNERLSASRE